MIFVECQGTSHSMVFLQGTVEKLRSSDVFIMDSSNYISSLYTLWKHLPSQLFLSFTLMVLHYWEIHYIFRKQLTLNRRVKYLCNEIEGKKHHLATKAIIK